MKSILCFLCVLFCFSCSDSEKKGTRLTIYIDEPNEMNVGDALKINHRKAGEIETTKPMGQKMECLTVVLPEYTSIRLYTQKTLHEQKDPLPSIEILTEGVSIISNLELFEPYPGKRKILDLPRADSFKKRIKEINDSIIAVKIANYRPRKESNYGNLETVQPDENISLKAIHLVDEQEVIRKFRKTEHSCVSYIVITNNAKEGFYDVMVNIASLNFKTMHTRYFFMVDLKENKVTNPNGDPVLAQKGYASFSLQK